MAVRERGVTQPLIVDTGRLGAGAAPLANRPAPAFEELVGLRPPSLGLKPSAGLDRLRELFSAGIPNPTPATRGLFEVVARGALSEAMVDYIIGSRQGLADLQADARRLRSRFEQQPTISHVLGNAALDRVAEARHFGDLTSSASNHARMGQLIARRFAGAVAPFDTRQQGALEELLTTGTLSQPTLDKLGRTGARRLAGRLGREQARIAQLPASDAGLLQRVTATAASVLKANPGAGAAQLESAIREQLSPPQRQAFIETQAAVKQAAAAQPQPQTHRASAQRQMEWQGTVEKQGSFERQIGNSGPRQPGEQPGWTDSALDSAFNAIPGMDKHFDARVEHETGHSVSGQAGFDNALGQAHVEGQAGVHARFEAHARGGITKDGDSLDAYFDAGFRAELSAEASGRLDANLFGGVVQVNAEGMVAVRAEAHANVNAQATFGFDENGRISAHVRGAFDVGVSVEAVASGRANVNVAGLEVAAEGHVGVMAGFRATGSAELGLKDGRLNIGFSLKLAFGVGFDIGGSLSIKIPEWMQNLGGSIKAVGGAIAGGVKKVGKAIKKLFKGW